MTTTAHLTRIQMDPWSRHVGDDLKDVQSLHRRVLALTPDQHQQSPRQNSGILFRLERSRTQHTLLIQSTAPLDLDALPPSYATAIDQRDLTPLLTWCAPGATIQYRLDAMATRSIATQERHEDGRRKRGHRIPVSGADAVTWWQRQAENAGLTLIPTTLRTTSQPDAVGWKAEHPEANKRIRFGKTITRFEGHAVISSPEALRQVITTGIGRARAYGAGLLSIAPTA
ncbi:type I-E CRISPR-associated protein Cas6/Cse3/CasE [Streptomyces noursei]|uniref:type I-E CRISPR-associated protein Cas6/Cse3/CasE n=1 Tax=Streptomyces noursei TaxID=1971 RepID=UPI00344CA8B2